MSELNGKVAVVTGGANGLGRAMTEAFVAHGARVVIADLDEAAGADAVAQLGDAVAFLATDVSSPEALTAAVNLAVTRFGQLDVMVNNAGIGSSPRRLMQDDFRDFERVMAVDLFGLIAGTQAAAKVMTEGGCVINVASIAGIQAGVGLATYRAAKAAVIHFSKCAAIELAELGLRVNVLCPGNIQTAINAAFDTTAIVRRTQPLQRIGSTTDVANAAVFLASERAAQVTGLVMTVDGGTSVGPPPRNISEMTAKPAE